MGFFPPKSLLLPEWNCCSQKCGQVDEQNHSAIVSNETGIDLLGCPPTVTSEYHFFCCCRPQTPLFQGPLTPLMESLSLAQFPFHSDQASVTASHIPYLDNPSPESQTPTLCSVFQNQCLKGRRGDIFFSVEQVVLSCKGKDNGQRQQ